MSAIAGHAGRLRERDADEQRAVLEAIDDRAAMPAAEHQRPPQREEHGRDGERRAGLRLHVDDEREHGEEVAERGDAGGAGQQLEVAVGRHGGDRAGPPLAHRSACVNVARSACGHRPSSTRVGGVLRVDLAGGLRLESDGAELAPPASRRARAILAYLALNPARTRAAGSPRPSGPTCSTSRPVRACAPRSASWARARAGGRSRRRDPRDRRARRRGAGGRRARVRRRAAARGSHRCARGVPRADPRRLRRRLGP